MAEKSKQKSRGGRWRLLVLGLLGGLVASGCTPLYMPVGGVLSAYSADHVVPHVQSLDDSDMAACGTGNSLQQLLGSFQGVGVNPHFVLFYTELLAGACAEAKANEANLQYLVARQEGRAAAARDARIAEQRWHALAAQRRLRAYNHIVARYGDPADARCPRLWGDDNQLAYLLGLVTGLQAVQSDLRSGAQVGVPRDIAVNAGRAASCLNNEKWWGVPQAIEATVWAFVPGTLPEGRDTWESFRQAAAVAERSNMRLAIALYGNGADNQGNEAEVRAALERIASVGRNGSPPEQYVLIDRLAEAVAWQLSDQIWISETGSRTPIGSLGRFPGSQQPAPDIDGLL